MSDPLADTLAVRKAREAGYSDQEIADHLQQTTPAVQQARQAGYQDSEIVDHLATPPTDDSKIHGIILGALKPLDNLAALASKIPGVAAADHAVAHALGMQDASQVNAKRDLAREGNTRTGYQTLGNIAGTLPTMAMKGGLAVQGAASGALLSDKKDTMGVATDALTGGLTSLLGGAALRGVGALGKTVTNKAAVALHDAGIDLSPGQLLQATGSTLGKGFRAAEDKARSVPILGSLIGGSRDRATNAVNQHLANDALGTIGKKAPADLAAGHDLMDAVDGQLSARYQQIIPHLVGHIDHTFANDMAEAKAVTNTIPDAQQKQFQNIVFDVFKNRTNGSTISGQNLKDAESKLTTLAKNYSKSLDPDQKTLGQSLFKVRQALRDMAVRSDPSGTDLQAVNQGWAKLQQMRKAANTKGIVLPGALMRQADKTGFGRDFAKAAVALMPDHVPNSGTADRLMAMKLAEMATGSVGGGAAGAAALTGHAGTAGASTLAALVAAAPYTKVGARLINRVAFAQKPAVVQKFGSLAQYAARGAPVAVPALLAHK